MTTGSLAEQLRDAGLRATAPRLAVARVLTESTDHPTVEQVAARARATVGTVSTQGVYLICEALYSAGLARRIEPAGSPVRYEARVGDNHHHLVCRSCGDTLDVDCAVGALACLEPSDRAGFTVDEAEVTYWGTCPACQSDEQGERP